MPLAIGTKYRSPGQGVRRGGTADAVVCSLCRGKPLRAVCTAAGVKDARRVTVYRYAWGPRGFGGHRGFDRKGQRCLVLKRCRMNTAVVAFEDGGIEVISRSALRKV